MLLHFLFFDRHQDCFPRLRFLEALFEAKTKRHVHVCRPLRRAPCSVPPGSGPAGASATEFTFVMRLEINFWHCSWGFLWTPHFVLFPSCGTLPGIAGKSVYVSVSKALGVIVLRTWVSSVSDAPEQQSGPKTPPLQLARRFFLWNLPKKRFYNFPQHSSTPHKAKIEGCNT